MKKSIILILVCTAFSSAAFSQLRLGPSVGLHLAKYHISPKDGDLKVPVIAGIHLGGAGEFMINENMGVESGMLIYIRKGSKTKMVDETIFGTETETYRFTTSHIVIPAHFKYSFMAEDLKLILKSGPYLSFTLSGKLKREYKLVGESNTESSTNTENLEIGNSNNDDIKPTDIGWDFAFGLDATELDIPIEVTLSYSIGLTNIIASPTGNNVWNNRVIQITGVYYLFDDIL